MYRIAVQAADEATLIYTVTDRAQTPWGMANTTILVPAEQLAGLVATLQTRLQEVQQQAHDQPRYSVGQAVLVTGHQREGQAGRVIEVRAPVGRGAAPSGEPWVYTVAFPDGMTWSYRAADLTPPA